MDTLKELADALGDDPNFAATMTNALAGKLSTSASCNRNWNWNGQSGQPDWLWGGNDGGNGKDLYVWKPSNFDVHSAQYIRPLSGDGNYKLAYTADGQRTNAGEWGRVVMRYAPNGQTYGVRVDRADYADSAGSAGNSNQLGGNTLAQVLAQINAGNTGGIIAASFGANGYVKWSNGFILLDRLEYISNLGLNARGSFRQRNTKFLFTHSFTTYVILLLLLIFRRY